MNVNTNSKRYSSFTNDVADANNSTRLHFGNVFGDVFERRVR